MIPYTQWRDKKLAEDPEFSAEYEKLKPKNDFQIELIKKRQAAGLTRKQVAERMDSSQSIVTRLETSFEYNPSLNQLLRYSEAVGCKLVLVSKDEDNSAELHQANDRF